MTTAIYLRLQEWLRNHLHTYGGVERIYEVRQQRWPHAIPKEAASISMYINSFVPSNQIQTQSDYSILSAK